VLPATHLEAVVIGNMMHTPACATLAHLARLHPDDFTDWCARAVFVLLSDMVTAGVSSVDPAAVLGHNQRTATITGEHKLTRLGLWLLDAYALWIPGALDYHVDLLLEASYRRAVHTYGQRLQQLAETRPASLAELDQQITHGATELAELRRRFATFAPARLTEVEAA
jgi:hypothetical protein